MNTPHPSDINKILDPFRKQSFTKRDKGDKFDCLMQRYLQTATTNKDRFADVWLWSEFPYRTDFAGGRDLGIAIICRTKSRGYWAVQYKYYKGLTLAVINTLLIRAFVLFSIFSYPKLRLC